MGGFPHGARLFQWPLDKTRGVTCREGDDGPHASDMQIRSLNHRPPLGPDEAGHYLHMWGIYRRRPHGAQCSASEGGFVVYVQTTALGYQLFQRCKTKRIGSLLVYLCR